MVLANLSDMMKPDILVEATATSKPVDTRGRMVLRAGKRLHMNVGDPNPNRSMIGKGVGDARSSD